MTESDKGDQPTAPLWFTEAMVGRLEGFAPRIISLESVRSTMMPLLQPEEPEDVSFDFSISVHHHPDREGDIMLIGDLFGVRDGLLVGATAQSLIRCKQGRKIDEAVARDLAYWAAHPLYDFARSVWRASTSGTPRLDDWAPAYFPEEINIDYHHPSEADQTN